MKFSILSCIGFLFLQHVSAQTVSTKFPVTNGKVLSSARIGDTLYIGGDFNRVGLADSMSDYGAALNPLTGQINHKWPKPNGIVRTAIPDGKSGFYIGGEFTMLGDSIRLRVAHIDSNGNVTAKLNGFGTDKAVYTMTLNNDTLFLGGKFNLAGNHIFGESCVLDTNGNVVNNPLTLSLRSNFKGITCIVSDAQGGYFIGGYLLKAGFSSGGIFHLDSMGHIDPTWFSILRTDTGSNTSISLNSLVIADHVLYVGGFFNLVDGVKRSNLAAIDLLTNQVLPWNPSPNGTVYCITFSNNIVFAGGDFTSVGGLTRGRLVAINRTTGIPTNWAPYIGGIVLSMEVYGNSIFIGGNFGYISNSSGVNYNFQNFGSIDTSSAAITHILSANMQVSSVQLYQNKLYVAGAFSFIHGAIRNGMAAFNPVSGALSSWNPMAKTYSAAVGRFVFIGSRVYLNGTFDSVGGTPRWFLASVDTGAGNVSGWYPSIGYSPVESFGYYLNFSFGNSIYIGGAFTLNGHFRNHLAGVNVENGQLISWNPPSGYIFGQHIFDVYAIAVRDNMVYINDGFISALSKTTGLIQWGLTTTTFLAEPTQMLLQGNTLYIGGAFSQINSVNRNCLGAVNINTHNVTSWNPNVVFGAGRAYISAMAYADGKIYVGGAFTTIGGQGRNNLAAVDTVFGSATPWTPNTSGLTGIRAICASADKIHVLGNKLYALDKVNGSLIAWSHPLAYAYNTTIDYSNYTLSVSGGTLYAGAEFTGLGGLKRMGLASINLKTATITSWNPCTNQSYIKCLVTSANKIYACGYMYIDVGEKRIAAIDRVSGASYNMNINPDNAVNTIAVSDNTIYASGIFTHIGTQTRNYLAALNATTGVLKSWNPNPNNFVSTLIVHGNRVYAGGKFTMIGGQTRNRIAALDTNAGSCFSWNPNADGEVRSLISNSNTVYAAGIFKTIGSQGRSYLAALDSATGMSKIWNPAADNYVNTVALSGNILYAGGAFLYLNDNKRNSLGSIDALTGQARNWNPDPDKEIFTICISDSIIATGGSFMNVGGINATSLAAISKDTGFNFTSPLSFACIGSAMNIFFSVTKSYNSGNIFKVQLSDSSGNYESGVIVGSYYGTTSGAIPVIIPAATHPGNAYRLRVISSNPPDTTAIEKPMSIGFIPKPGFTLDLNAQCLNGNRFVFSDTSKIDQGTLKSFWSFGDATYSAGSNPVKTYVNPGVYTVKLFSTSNLGCTDSAIKTVIVHPKPQTGFSINNPNQCISGNNFIFNDTSKVSSGNITRLWRFSSSLNDTSTNQTPVKTYNIANSYSIKLIETSDKGCKDSLLKTISVFTIPAVGFTINNSSQCVNNNSFSFSDTSYNGMLIRKWDFGTGTYDTSSGANPVKHYPAAGNYTVKLLAYNGSCKDSVSKSILVLPKPVAAFTVNNDQQCLLGNSFIFNDTSPLSNGPLKRLWNFGDYDTSTFPNPSKTYQNVNDYLIQLTVIDLENCRDTFTRIISVTPQPKAGFSSNSFAQCLNGNRFFLRDTSVIEVGTFSIKWDFDDNTTSTFKNPSKVFSVPKTYLVKLIVTSYASCKDSIVTPITVFPQPGATIATSGSTNICTGQWITLNANHDTGYTYKWKRNGNIINQAYAFDYTTNLAGNYKVIVSSPHQCTDTSAVTMVSLLNLPSANIFFTGKTTFCDGNSLILYAAGTGSTYQWYRNNLPYSTNPSITVNLSGSYKVKISNGCDSVTLPVLVIVNHSPQKPIITQLLNSLYSSSATGNQWYLNQSPISGATSQTYTPQQNGSYFVTVTNSDSCSNTSDTFQFVLNGIHEYTKQSELNIYPNPNNGKFTVTSSELIELIELIDPGGKVILKQRCDGKNTIELNFSLPPALYFIKVITEEECITRKILVH
ncbi:MAG: PKD domain-containing protein [Bacteroidota bacterium]|nr:PKD domain-containing protein [Bacteroidota bacterium]